MDRQDGHLETAAAGEGGCILRLAGRLDAYTVADLWPRALEALEDHREAPVQVDPGGVTYCDGAGVALILDLLRRPRTPPVTLMNVPDKVQRLLDPFDPALLSRPPPPRTPPQGALQRLVEIIHGLGQGLHAQVAFIGEATAALAHALLHPHRVRWGDAVRIARRAGADALPIVGLIALLLGVILAFQSAVAMKQFGAEIFVANLVALSLLRELAPLMTAILLAGRSASAFAAEIGTMKVNEELDALTTMGLDPLRFLVVTRILAAVLVTPLLTLFANLVGLVGAALVLLTFDIPLVTFLNQVSQSVSLTDLVGGLVKAVVFGLLVAGVGCLRGLQTRNGAAAVGEATTRAVVSAIVLIVAVDGLFAVIYFHLGI
ncbi:MAG: ABC transporter permease [Ectothiorhodospira sp.]